MKKILVTRKLLDSNEEKLKKLYDVKLNSNDELYSQKKLIEMSQGCDGILSALTDKFDKETINLLPESVKILSNFAVGFGNIDLEAAKKKKYYCYKYTRSLNRCYSRNRHSFNSWGMQKSFRGNRGSKSWRLEVVSRLFDWKTAYRIKIRYFRNGKNWSKNS